MQILSKRNNTYEIIWKIIHCCKTLENTGGKACYIIPTIPLTLLLEKWKWNISKLPFLIKCATHLRPGHVGTSPTDELSGIIVIPLSSLSIAASFATKIRLGREHIQMTAVRKPSAGRSSLGEVGVRERGLRKHDCVLDTPLQCHGGCPYRCHRTDQGKK